MDAARISELTKSQGDADDIKDVRKGYASLLERWREDEVGIDRRIWGWIFNTALWWVILSAMLSFLGAALWVIQLIFLHNQQLLASQRHQEGLCANCGYNLYGLDFHGRCPECGTIIK